MTFEKTSLLRRRFEYFLLVGAVLQVEYLSVLFYRKYDFKGRLRPQELSGFFCGIFCEESSIFKKSRCRLFQKYPREVFYFQKVLP